MRINYNVSAMLSNNALANNDSLLAQSLERLSSGLKINHAKDNPAGLAMAKRMNAQLEGLSVANQNASDGVSIIEIADGAMTEISEMLQRINELAIKSANGIMSDSDRETVQEEVAQLKEEITRISETTEFNGQKLLNGEFEYKGYTNNLGIKVNGYSEEVATKVYTIDEVTISAEKDEDGSYKVDTENIKLGDGFPEGTVASVKDNILTLKADTGFEMRLDISGVDFGGQDSVTIKDDAATTDKVEALQIDVTGIGAMRLQIGANEGQILAVEIPAISLQNMEIENIDVSTGEGALDAIERVDSAIKYVSGVRGRLGAYQNRLESTINSLDITSENMTAAYSRIMDVDMAEEMTQYTTAQVLTQAGTSMLAQANERPSQVLQLLQ
ncbi:MAG: flagellin [Acetatifactor sp.]